METASASQLCDCVGPSLRRDRFVDAVGWTRKETDLLAGDDCDGARRETIEILGGFGRELRAGGETGVLLAQDFNDRAASFRVKDGLLRRRSQNS